MFLNKYKLHSIRLVVGADQLPRALKELSTKIPSDITIIPHPISKKKTDYNKTFKEYIKYNLILIASFIGVEDELDLSYS